MMDTVPVLDQDLQQYVQHNPGWSWTGPFSFRLVRDIMVSGLKGFAVSFILDELCSFFKKF